VKSRIPHLPRTPRLLRAAFASTVAAALTALLVAGPTAARAEEVRVLAAGAAKHALERIAPEFERATGHRIAASYDTVGAQRDRVLAQPPGQAAGVVVLSDSALDQLAKANRLASAPRPIGQVVVALAVPAHAAPPALATAAQLREALLAAPSLAYADPARGATAGGHFAQVLDALGVREQVQSRITVLPFGVDVIQGVSQGRFALGVSQSSEILQHPEVRYAGPLPAPHGLATGYGAAMAADNAAARALLDFLSQPAAQAHWRESGFVAP
jgi:molybdate transport system substrate-binding protein